MHRALRSTSVSTTAIKFEATFHHHDLVKVIWRSSKKNSFWEKSQDNEKKLEDFLRSTLRRFHHFFSWHLEEFPTNRHLEKIFGWSTIRFHWRNIATWKIPSIKKWLRFSSLSLKTSATFQRTKITDFLLGYGEEKASTLEEERFHCQVEEIEVYESSSHEERKKPFQDNEKNGHLLYILPLQIMPTMRQKKKKSIFKLFHPQNKTTENLNLRIKEATLK